MAELKHAYHVRMNGEKQSDLGAGGYMSHQELCEHLPRLTKGLKVGEQLTVHCEAMDKGRGDQVRRGR